MAFMHIQETQPGGSADFLPVLKYKANAGRLILVQRTQTASGDWESQDEDVTKKEPAFAVDFGSIETGWLDLGTGGAPVKVTVPYGQKLPPQPPGKREGNGGRMVDCFQQGFRVKVVGKSIATPDGGIVREFASTSKTVCKALNKLHDTFEAAPEAREGKIPVVKIVDSEAVQVQTPKGTNTFYAPVFEIVTWTARPEDVFGPRTVPAPSAPPPQATPQTTGEAIGDDLPF